MLAACGKRTAPRYRTVPRPGRSNSTPRRGFRQIGFFSLKGAQFTRQTPHHAVAAYLRLVDALFVLLRPNF